MWFLNVYADPDVDGVGIPKDDMCSSVLYILFYIEERRMDVLEERLDVERYPNLDTNKDIRLCDNGANHRKETTKNNIVEKEKMNHLKQELFKRIERGVYYRAFMV